MTPARKPFQSMLPPWRSEVAVETAWCRSGATPKQPIIGASGTRQCASSGTSSGEATPASTSTAQSMRAGRSPGQGGVAGIEHVGSHPGPGVAAVAIGANRLQVHRQGVRRARRRPPGTGRSAGCRTGSRRRPVASQPPASTVVVATRSPDSMVSTGSCGTEGGVVVGGNELMIGQRRLLRLGGRRRPLGFNLRIPVGGAFDRRH